MAPSSPKMSPSLPQVVTKYGLRGPPITATESCKRGGSGEMTGKAGGNWQCEGFTTSSSSSSVPAMEKNCYFLFFNADVLVIVRQE